MSDNDVIDLDEERKRREAADVMRELGAELQPRTLVRRTYGLKKWCTHRETEVDDQARIIQCRACQTELDAFDVLGVIAHEHGAHAAAVADRKKIQAEIVELRAEEKKIKGRLRAARAKLPPDPPADGELLALRRLREAVDSMGYVSHARVRKALLALDAVRTETSEVEQ